MDSIRHINYKSDFIIRERFRDASGAFVAIPQEVDFELRYWVKPGRQFIASRIGGEYTNCTPDGDALLVIFKDHGFCEGVLKHELHLRLVNGFMPDGVQNVYYPEDMAVQLWHLGDDALGVIESGVVAAYTRGLPFTFADFTPAQIEILQRPALDAAQKADAATTRATNAAAEAERLTGELSRTGAKVFKDCTDATSEARAATQNADAATADAQAATTAARDATDKMLKQARELDTTSGAAVRDCNTATAAADKSKAAADIAAKSATDAATETNAQRELTEQSRQRLEAVADRAELAAAPVPDGLRVDCPAKITIGNPVARFISARVLPPSALQNVIYQAFGGAAGVEPDGRILPFRPGTARVHVIPTGGTRFYKTVTVQVVAPALRLAAPGVLRLDSAGNIRLT